MLKSVVIVFMVLALSACGKDGSSSTAGGSAAASTPIAKRQADFVTVQTGFKVYRANCAACHGSEGQGAPNWQKAGPDGKYPAPPLNGTGHTWHHPMPVLVNTIKNGTQRIGGNMPPWRDKLTDAEISTIIAWFQSRWPDKLYQAWARTDREARK